MTVHYSFLLMGASISLTGVERDGESMANFT